MFYRLPRCLLSIEDAKLINHYPKEAALLLLNVILGHDFSWFGGVWRLRSDVYVENEFSDGKLPSHIHIERRQNIGA